MTSTIPSSLATPRPSPSRLRYQPALDGLRGVALLGVLAYHSGIDFLPGGFLGVSSFFTLSGFLITSLLLVERVETGRVGLSSFWGRRVRRLMPAALLTIVITVLLASVIGDDSQLSRLRLDSLSSLFHFSNWRFIAGGDSYGAVFESPSFFRHFWSLALEEQYYVVFPLLVAGGLRLTRGPGRVFAATLGVVAAAALVWPALLLASGASTDRLYFGTDTRLGELVLGAVLALWWVKRGSEVPDRPVSLTVAAVGAIAVMAAMWTTAHPGDHFLYQGGFALHAALTVVVIVAAVATRGPVRTVLAFEPLRRLGVISYGAYLFHWPILLLLQQETSMGPAQRLVVGSAITFGLAELSHRFIEGPIRRTSSASVGRRIWAVVPASFSVAALVLAVTMWRTPQEAPIDFAGVEAELAALVTGLPDAATSTPSLAPGARVLSETESAEVSAAPLLVSGFGDSTALMTGVGVAQWADENPDAMTMVLGEAKLGCGLVAGGTRQIEDGEVVVPEECDSWLSEWADALDGQHVDLSFVQVGAWEIVDHQLETGGPFLAIGRDVEYEALLRTNLDAAIAVLVEHSDVVALISPADVGAARLATVPVGSDYPEYDPTRMERWREIVEEAAAANPAVIVIDLGNWIDNHPDDTRIRPDGVHFSLESSREVAEWLGPEILLQHQQWLHTGGTSPAA